MRCSTKTILSILSLVAAAACSNSGGDEEILCDGQKCDTPGDAANAFCQKECSDDSNWVEGEDFSSCRKRCRDEQALLHCEARRSDAIDGAQKTFTKDAIRWACSDVDGVNTNGRDDRGQEYCEYFPAIQLPPKAEGETALPDVVTPGRNQDGGRPPLPLALDLTEDQIFALEDNPDAVVGQCVFTSWHQDIREPLPICNGSDTTCPELSLTENAQLPPWSSSRSLGLKLTESIMKMKISINSNSAAADLFEKCITEPEAGDAGNPEDPLHDDFIRGCFQTYKLFQTEWRRSDPSVCAAGIRLAECGCGVDTDGDGVADITDAKEVSLAVVPPQPDQDGTVRLRGFPLGTWSGADELPAGCTYEETGDTTKNLVKCDMKASDLLANQNDPKEFCRAKYGDNVVVHVPVPSAAIVCNPPSEGQYNNCTSMPWIVGEVSTPPGGDGDGDGDGDADACSFETTVAQDGPATAGECACVDAICGADSWCCDNQWDTVCANAAAEEAACQ